MKTAYSTALKVAAFITATVLAVIFALTGFVSIWLYEEGAHREDSFEKSTIYSNITYSYLGTKFNDIRQELKRHLSKENLETAIKLMSRSDSPYLRSKVNLYYVLSDKDGNVLYSSSDETEYCAHSSISFFVYGDSVEEVVDVYEEFESDPDRYNFVSSLTEQLENDYGSAEIFDENYGFKYDDSGEISRYTYSAKYNKYSKTEYKLDGYVPTNLSADDALAKSISTIGKIYDNRNNILIAFLISALGFAALIIYICCAAGHVAGTDGIHLTWYDKIPLDALLLMSALIEIVGFFLTIRTVEFFVSDYLDITAMPLSIAVIELLPLAAIAVSVLRSFAVRVKAGKFWRNSFIFMGLRLIKRLLLYIVRGLKWLSRNMHIYVKAALILFSILLIEFIVLILSDSTIILPWFIKSVILTVVVIFVSVYLYRLQKGAEEIAGGNLNYQIDLSHMPQSLKQHGERLNSIRNGLSKAVDKQIRSERMKTELITNVSHDIKTPLTSIINYVDLLKKAGSGSDKADEYIEVIDRQSHRLKKLLEDLVEAAKASTGSIGVNMEPTDLNLVLTQAAAEYEDKFSNNDLELVLSTCNGNPTVMADGRLLWRVFDNLMNNIVKYAQKGTRVYIECLRSGNMAYVVFKNISRSRLDISSDDLMERFVRGDQSRNSNIEGSGLGLSIAKSLTELQNGKFDIIIDGDLFKAMVVFNVMQEVQ